MARWDWSGWKEAVTVAIGTVTLGGLIGRPLYRELIRPFWDRRLMAVLVRCRKKVREILEAEFSDEMAANKTTRELAEANKDRLEGFEAAIRAQGLVIADTLSIARTLEPLPQTLDRLNTTIETMGRTVNQTAGSVRTLEKFLDRRHEERRRHDEPVEHERRQGERRSGTERRQTPRNNGDQDR